MAQNPIWKLPTAAKPLDALKESFWAKVLLIAAIYVSIQVWVLNFQPEGWAKYWVLQPPASFQYWDAGIYAQLSLAPACTAFYPLWPRLIQGVAGPMSLTQALRFSMVGSEMLFLASLPIALFTFEKLLKHKSIAFLSVFLYALGPNAVFHSVGYTESLFSFLSLFFLLIIHILETLDKTDQLRIICLYGCLISLATLLSFTRPVLIQSCFAIAFTLFILWLFQVLSQQPHQFTLRHFQAIPSRVFSMAIAIGLGNIIGYSFYGVYCLRTTGNFFTPFHAQVEWGRTLGFRPWLLLLPRTLLIDLHGLYTGLLLFAAIAWLLWSYYRGIKTPRLTLPKHPWMYLLLIHPFIFSAVIAGLNGTSNRFVRLVKAKDITLRAPALLRFSILYAIAFSSVHSVINFLANTGNLYSTSRHFFGTPFAFLGIGALLSVVAIPQLIRLTWFIAIAGVILLAEQWVSFASDGWLG